jgi:signal transduction histidine kinase
VAKQINLQAQITENLYLTRDEVQLTRVFTNLIENALNYTLSEGVVEIKISQNITHLEIDVKDTGVKIALED